MSGYVSERLRSVKHRDGFWHARFPTALRTLCGQPAEPQQRGRPAKVDCASCVSTARHRAFRFAGRGVLA